MIRWLASFAFRFLACSMPEEPTYSLGIEFVAGSFTDITTRCVRANWSLGVVDLFNPPRAEEAMFDMDNLDGLFSTRTNSLLTVGRPLRLTATYAGSSYPLFFGRVKDITGSPIIGKRRTLITAVDDWEHTRQKTYTTSLFANTPVQSVLTTLMSMSNVRSFDVSSLITDNLDFAWWRDVPAHDALHSILRNTGHQAYIDGAGTYHFQSRYWSLFGTAVSTLAVADNLRTELRKRSVVNQAKINAAPRQQSTNLSTLARIPEVLILPASSHVNFSLVFQDPDQPGREIPVGSITPMVSSQDYYSSANSNGTGNNFTSNLSLSQMVFAATAVNTIYNGGPTAFLQRFQIRGYPLTQLPQIATEFNVESSQTRHGVANLTLENALIQRQTFMDSYAKFLAGDRMNGRDEGNHRLTNEFPDILRAEPGSVYSLVDVFTGFTGQWRIRRSSHELNLANGLRHSVTYDIENYDNIPWLVLDDPARGKLDDGRMLAI